MDRDEWAKNGFNVHPDLMDVTFPCGRVDAAVSLDFCESECPFGKYYTCDTVAMANDALRDAELRRGRRTMTKNGVVEIHVRKYIMYIEDIADYIREKLGLTPAVNGYGNENTPYEDQVCPIDVDGDVHVIVARDYISIEKSHKHGCILKPHVTIRFMFPDEISGMSYDEIAEKVIDAINEWR